MSDDPDRDIGAGAADDYDSLLADVRGIIEGARQQAAAAVNSAMVLAYWRIGERIVMAEQGGAARAGYGEHLLVRLGRELAYEFGRGFSERSLRNMRQFYQAYQNRSELRTELSWTHYRILMRLPLELRDFYERLTISNRMKLYLEWFRRYDKAEGEADPIGLILCGSKNQQVVELPLSDPNERIRVSQYLTISDQQAIKDHLSRMAEMRDRLVAGSVEEAGG